MSNDNQAFAWDLTHIDLLSERYGGQALSCNDEFFAGANNLVKRSEPIFIHDKYTDRGKWMDGWETRRRRTPGHDWCVLRLGIAGTINAVNIDTTHFKGNAPASISLEACEIIGDPVADTPWTTIVSERPVNAHSQNLFEVKNPHSWTHLRLKIYPDGGVARLRVWGEPRVDWSRLLPHELVDLAASTNGGRAVACSDMFFSPMNNLIAPNRGINMGDGWETRRRRTPGYDWIVVRLACPGKIMRLLVDTLHFKGNFPESFLIQAAHLNEETAAAAHRDQYTQVKWDTILEQHPLKAHSEHIFQDEILNQDHSFNFIRLQIFPDGGISRLRIFGYPEAAPK